MKLMVMKLMFQMAHDGNCDPVVLQASIFARQRIDHVAQHQRIHCFLCLTDVSLVARSLGCCWFGCFYASYGENQEVRYLLHLDKEKLEVLKP